MEDVLPCMRSNDPGLVLEEKFVTSPPPTCPKLGGKNCPAGLLGGQGSIPLVPSPQWCSLPSPGHDLRKTLGEMSLLQESETRVFKS